MEETAITPAMIDEIKTQVKNAEGKRGEQDALFTRYREMFFMTNADTPKYGGGIDKKDIKVTPSPASRNEVLGMQRLLNTSNVQVKVKVGDEVDGNSDKIERALKKMLNVSSEGKLARVEADAMLSAVLYGPVIVYAESIDDLLKVEGIKPYRKVYLEKKRMKSPFLIRTINPEESTIEKEDGQTILSSWKSTVKGTKLKAKWGIAEASPNRDYIVHDVFTPEIHLVYADGISKPLFVGEHLLGCVPVFSSVAGGSELFHKPEEQINSYLYAKAKGNLDIRENAVLTAIFTNLHTRGLVGPLFGIKPETAPETINVNHTGGIRTIVGDATLLDDKVIDPTLMGIRELLQDLSGESTIRQSTLGQNTDGATFSSLAMLASSGKLPMIDSQRALEGAFKDCFEHILYRIKTEVIATPLIEPSEIPEQYELEVTFVPKLPQDTLRNAQIATTLSGKVSDEYIQQEILQVDDAASMRKQITREAVVNALRMQMTQNPAFIGELFNKVVGMQAQPQQIPPGADQMTDDPNAQPTGVAGNMNVEVNPMQEPMRPIQERT